jgi:hypothetical protein
MRRVMLFVTIDTVDIVTVSLSSATISRTLKNVSNSIYEFDIPRTELREIFL